MHEFELDGVWADREHGGTMTLSLSGDTLTGRTTGGQWHETLRGTFTGHRCDGGFEGELTNHEGVVTGGGRARLEIVSPDELRFTYSGNWSGGGASGHVEGRSILHKSR